MTGSGANPTHLFIARKDWRTVAGKNFSRTIKM
jgi:hypothetical protein